MYYLLGTSWGGRLRMGVASLALAACLGGCTSLMKDEQPSVLGTGETEQPAPDLAPVPVVEGLVVQSGAAGAGTCRVIRVESGDDTASLSDEEAQAAFSCLSANTGGLYAESPHLLTRAFSSWTRVDRAPFEVAALDSRYAAVFANPRALSQDPENTHRDRSYDVGATLAVVTFSIGSDGAVELGPLVFVEKMPPGFAPLQGNWRYTFIDNEGSVDAVTQGKNADSITLCAECTHGDADRLYLSLLNNGQIPL